MTRTRIRPRRLVAALTVLGLALLAITPAVAEPPPPPPDFIKFTITNLSNTEAHNINLEIWQSKKNFTLLEQNPTATQTLPQLMPGQSHTFQFQNMFGVAKIRCTADCPAGNPSPPVTVQATQGQLDPPPAPMQFAGFTVAPTSAGDVPSGLEILPPNTQGGKNRLRVTAFEKWRAGHWLLKEDTKDFP